jgi:hypothetical protein
MKHNKKDDFCFKAKSLNLEVIDKGNLFVEIRPIHKPKKTKWNQITALG